MKKLQKENLNNSDIQKQTIYNDGELALINNIHDISSLLPCKLDINVAVLVAEGKAQIMINDILYEAQKNDLFICTPNNIINSGMTSIDFKGYFICISMEYLQRIFPLTDNSWDFKLLFKENPKYTLQPNEAIVFHQYYDLLCSKAQQTSPTQKKVMDTLVIAFIYDMQGTLIHVVQNNPRPFTSGENLFKRFIDLINSSYPKQRSVSYYAEQLNVTPKYLAAVCKNVSGEKASELINRYVLEDIDYLMKHSSKSIKEIACELDFTNLSFFGKYVRKHFGISPKSYREMAIKEQKLDSLQK